MLVDYVAAGAVGMPSTLAGWASSSPPVSSVTPVKSYASWRRVHRPVLCKMWPPSLIAVRISAINVALSRSQSAEQAPHIVQPGCPQVTRADHGLTPARRRFSLVEGGRVAEGHCCPGAPSEPACDFHRTGLKQAQSFKSVQALGLEPNWIGT